MQLLSYFRVIAPIEAIAIIGWWAYDLISGSAGDGEKWYVFGRETLVMTLTQVNKNNYLYYVKMVLIANKNSESPY